MSFRDLLSLRPYLTKPTEKEVNKRETTSSIERVKPEATSPPRRPSQKRKAPDEKRGQVRVDPELLSLVAVSFWPMFRAWGTRGSRKQTELPADISNLVKYWAKVIKTSYLLPILYFLLIPSACACFMDALFDSLGGESEWHGSGDANLYMKVCIALQSTEEAYAERLLNGAAAMENFGLKGRGSMRPATLSSKIDTREKFLGLCEFGLAIHDFIAAAQMPLRTRSNLAAMLEECRRLGRGYAGENACDHCLRGSLLAVGANLDAETFAGFFAEMSENQAICAEQMLLPGECLAGLSRRLAASLEEYWTGYPRIDLETEVGPLQLSVLLCEVPHTVRRLLETGKSVHALIKRCEALYEKKYQRATMAVLAAHRLIRSRSDLSAAVCPFESPIATIGSILSLTLAPSLKRLGSEGGPFILGVLKQGDPEGKQEPPMSSKAKKRERSRLYHEKLNARLVAEGKEPLKWVERG